MIEIKQDKKSPTWVVTKTDSEGFHHQITMTRDELDQLTLQWMTKRQQ